MWEFSTGALKFACESANELRPSDSSGRLDGASDTTLLIVGVRLAAETAVEALEGCSLNFKKFVVKLNIYL